MVQTICDRIYPNIS